MHAGPDSSDATSPSSVDVFFIPLGVNGEIVRWVGRIYDAVLAARDRRPRCELYHAALEVRVAGALTRIEMSLPVHRHDTGIVAEGPVGARWLGRWRTFRYELRCWPGVAIPDVPASRGGPVHPLRVPCSAATASRIIALVAEFPIRTWGRDEFGAGEMWNSNSFVSWLLERGGIPTRGIRPPSGGRAPGWDAGVAVAVRPSVMRDATPRSLRRRLHR